MKKKIHKELAIITPSYNNGIFLKRLYKSIDAQTYKHYVWIIIDDGSIDGTEKIVNNFKNKNIIYIKQKNQGANSARKE